jgi:hypothetical protein
VAHYGASLLATNARGLVFTGTAPNLIHHIFGGPFDAEFWQIAENSDQHVTVEIKLQFHDEKLQK